MTDLNTGLELEAKQFQLLSEEIDGVLWSMDRDLRFLSSVGQGLKKLGLRPNQVVGMTLDEYLAETPPDQVAVVVEAHERALAGETGRYTLELPGGLWQCRVEPLVIDGEVQGCMGVGFDVIELRDLERSSALADLRLDYHRDNSPLGMIEWNADFRVMGWSRGCERIFGWSAEEVWDCGWDSWQFVFEEDKPAVEAVVEGLLSGETPRSVWLNRNYTKDGRIVWCEWFNSVMLDASGELVSIVSNVQDVTERETAKQELRALNDDLERRVRARTEQLTDANARLELEVADRRKAQSALERREHEIRIITNHLPALVAYVDNTYRYRFANSQHEAWYGIDAPGIAGRRVADVMGERAFASTKPYFDRALSGQSIHVETRIDVSGEPEPRWVHLRMVPDLDSAAESGEGGAEGVEGLYVLVTDVTGFRRAERELRLVSAAIDQVNELVIITDSEIDRPGPRIMFANRAFYEHTGFTEAETIGKTPRILQGPRTDRRQLDRLRQCLKTGTPFVAETYNYRKDGGEYLVSWHIAPVRDAAGNITNWVSIQRDITQQRHKEAAQRVRDQEMAHAARLATLGEMASGIAHEVNQPLAAIANYASGSLRRLADETSEPAEIATALRAIERQAERSGAVIKRVRSFASRRDHQRERVGLDEVLDDVIGLLEPDLRRLSFRVELEVEPSCPDVWVDRVHFEQVLVNLLRNAVDASGGLEEARRVVRLVAEPREAGVRLRVIDRGPGFAGDVADRLFEPFYSTKDGGMGMGLNISQTLVESMGGTIEASSDARGAVFTVWVPAVGDEAADETSADGAVVGAAGGSKLRGPAEA
ncbi:MAG: PAS domain S-box protein [Planctomycetota bacterium]